MIRSTADRNLNMYGNSFLEFCRNNNLFIMNGRIGSDFTQPKLTCKERSTVDYFIASSSILENIQDFNVIDFNCLFSDAHCALRLTLLLKHY